ncbi:unnamed protein product [Arctogadus glacialis]
MCSLMIRDVVCCINSPVVTAEDNASPPYPICTASAQNLPPCCQRADSLLPARSIPTARRTHDLPTARRTPGADRTSPPPARNLPTARRRPGAGKTSLQARGTPGAHRTDLPVGAHQALTGPLYR